MKIRSYKRSFLLVVVAHSALVLAGIVALQIHLNNQEWAGMEINVARRQQVRAEHVLTQALGVVQSKAQGVDPVQSVKAFRKSINQLEDDYAGLRYGSQDFRLDGKHSPEVLAFLSEVEPALTQILESSRTIADAPGDASLDQAIHTLSLNVDQFKSSMDFVVHQFITENTHQMAVTGRLYWIGGGLLVLGLILSFVLVMRPLLGRMERQNRELVDLNVSLENVSRVKGDFLANMSHEIRTPLNGVIGMSELLGKTPLTDQQSDYRNTIQRSAENLMIILNDILDYSKLDAGKMRLDPAPFNIHTCMEDVVDVMRPSTSAKGLELVVYIDPEVPEVLVQDEHRIKQVLFNLIGNAIKFTRQGEVEVNLKATSSHADLLQLQCSVRDTGIGMDPSVIPMLFSSFTQADNSTTRKFGGTGLGLSICRELVGLMGGRIWAESNPGDGSTFTFTLVAERADAVTDFSQRSVKGMKVLVVDDNMTNLKILVKQLSNWGVQATPFNSPNLVLEVMDNLDKFDLCILDMQMPEMDGHQLTRRIRERYSREQLPIVVLSSVGQSLLQDEEGLYNHYLTKPVKQNRLLRTLQSLSGISTESEAVQNLGRGNVAVRSLEQDDLRILIAEDNELQQAVTARNLQLLGYNAQSAFNGQEVLEKMNKHQFDLILMDVDMPVLNGVETTRKIKSLYSKDEAPIIIGLAENPAKSNVRNWKNQGMDDVMATNSDPEVLGRKIRYWFPYSDQ